MNWIIKIVFSSILFLSIIFPQNICFSQLDKICCINFSSEADIFIDQITNEKYSNLITVKFRPNVIRKQAEYSEVKISEIYDSEIKLFFTALTTEYGNLRLLKLIPSAEPEDTLCVNKRTGEIKVIPDWSQVFQIIFDNLVPINTVISRLEANPKIVYASPPFQAYSTIEPNDSIYTSYKNWAFENIHAPEAWDITKGDSNIIIAIHDNFGYKGVTQVHEDLAGKLTRHKNKFGNHGMCVAGIAGANTNNKIGVASLGWNLKLSFCDLLSVSDLFDAADCGADVINFSWTTKENFPHISDAIKTLLTRGIVCVASAGNHEFKVPAKLYPAAYNYGELGQVIAVSGTQWNGEEESFIEGNNYCPGSDFTEDPSAAFIDVSAPGRDIEILCGISISGYSRGCGTSLATPFVSALAGLMLSVDSTLTPNDIYEIITSTTDKIGQDPYDENGWNKFLGYGRINALKALEKVKGTGNVTHFRKTDESLGTFKLFQNYPNPFNPSTTIKYSIPVNVITNSNKVERENMIGVDIKHTIYNLDLKDQVNVVLKVYDILGREIEALVNKRQNPGIYEVEWNANNFPSGVYFYSLQIGNIKKVRKMMLLK